MTSDKLVLTLKIQELPHNRCDVTTHGTATYILAGKKIREKLLIAI